jgi:hypothetical protein
MISASPVATRLRIAFAPDTMQMFMAERHQCPARASRQGTASLTNLRLIDCRSGRTRTLAQ